MSGPVIQAESATTVWGFVQSYTRSEVLWLLSLTHDAALAMDTSQRDSCASLHSSDDGAGSTSAEDPGLMTVIRWNDVNRVRDDVIREKEGIAILQLRAAGYGEEEIAALTGRHRLAVRRRWQASVDEILERLGGEQDERAFTLSTVDACLKCGHAPRVRLEEVRVRIKGGWRISQPARQASVCVACLSPELAFRVHRELGVAA